MQPFTLYAVAATWYLALPTVLPPQSAMMQIYGHNYKLYLINTV